MSRRATVNMGDGHMCLSLSRLCLLISILLTFVVFTTASSLAGPSCTCRYAGQSFQVNSCVCITTAAAKPQVACCGMVVNNPSWTFTNNACPTADLPPLQSQPIEVAATAADASPTYVDIFNENGRYPTHSMGQRSPNHQSEAR